MYASSALSPNRKMNSWSHHDAAVHAERLSGDITGVGRSQKCRGVGDVFRRPSFSKWNLGMQRLFDFVRQPRSHVGGDESRRDSVYSDIPTGKLAGERFGETD